MDVVLDAGPSIFGHNVETVPRLYGKVRSHANYRRSLDLLGWAKERGVATKSGIMIGLGETTQDIASVVSDLADIGLDVLTIGQYLQPTPRHMPVVEFHPPAQFEKLKRAAEQVGIGHVVSGPLVRSSYHAAEHADLLLR